MKAQFFFDPGLNPSFVEAQFTACLVVQISIHQPLYFVTQLQKIFPFTGKLELTSKLLSQNEEIFLSTQDK